MQCTNGTMKFQKFSSMESPSFTKSEQLNQQTTNQTLGFKFNNMNNKINDNDNFIGQKPFSTNINFQNQTHFQEQGIAMPFNNQFQNIQFSNKIDESKKERESQMQDLMNIAKKAVQRRKERIIEKYFQPNQNIIEEEQK